MSFASQVTPFNSGPPNPGHASRRENQSVSSTHSRTSERSSSSRSATHPPVESAVTRLLMAIKQLLEALTQWSKSEISENDVSDVYVRLGNDFNAAVVAFTAYNIDMSELASVPDDLRTVLEQCLSEDASTENLDIYLPTVRQIITRLLQGLRTKQAIYRAKVNESKQRPSQQAERMESRSSRTSRRDPNRNRSSRSTAEGERLESTTSRRGPQGARRRELATTQSVASSTSDESSNTAHIPGPDAETKVASTSNGIVESQQPRREPRAEAESSDVTIRSEPGLDRSISTTPQPRAQTPNVAEIDTPTNRMSSAPQVPASVKRYSLVDKPASPPPTLPPTIVEEPASPQATNGHLRNESSTPPPDTPPLDATQAPAMANSLAALKKSDALERRASKRFSTYTFSKMTGTPSTTRERSLRGQNNRRSLAASNTLTAGDLAVLTEVDENQEPAPRREDSVNRKNRSRSASRPSTPDRPPVPPLPVTPSRTPEPPIEHVELNESVETESSGSPSRFTVFLQLGREVKKATIEPGLSFPSLRVLFVDKFSYNPGLENFPAIYIRDPSSGVQYELEDTDEVKEKCLLSLNIEPLDQIKQHIDSQISNLSRDIKDLRSVVSTNRHSMNMQSIVVSPLTESTVGIPRPSDGQFAQVARRVTRIVNHTSPAPGTWKEPTMLPQMTGKTIQPQMTGQTIQPQMTGSTLVPQMTGMSLQPQMTGGSVLSEYSSRVVTDLKTQFDEVQNLRRDLGIMRQLYSEFMKTTKESLGTLRTQTQTVKQLANSKVGGARGYIDSGKQKLDSRSQNVLTDVEKLQDTVESVKDDVLKRHITPKPQQLKTIKADVDRVATELASLQEHIKTIKPMWKKTWEEELQNIVEEQQFLTHQEELLSDLLEDHKSVLEIYGHVEKVISLRGGGVPGRGTRNRSFKPAPPEEGHNGLSTVMLEIRGASVDPERRLKAIEASQKNREKDLATRSDDFQAELSEGAKKLKMTGGAEEAERVRQKRNEMTRKAMFNINGSNGGSLSPSPSFQFDSLSPATTPAAE